MKQLIYFVIVAQFMIEIKLNRSEKRQLSNHKTIIKTNLHSPSKNNPK